MKSDGCFEKKMKAKAKASLFALSPLGSLSSLSLSYPTLSFLSWRLCSKRKSAATSFFSFRAKSSALQSRFVVMRAASSAATTSCSSSRPASMSSALPRATTKTTAMATAAKMPRRSRSRCVRVAAAAASDSGACVSLLAPCSADFFVPELHTFAPTQTRDVFFSSSFGSIDKYKFSTSHPLFLLLHSLSLQFQTTQQTCP